MTVSRERTHLGGADSAPLVADLLQEASRTDTSAQRAYEVDRDVVEALRESVHADAILAEVELALLAELVERIASRLDEAAAGEARDRGLVWDVLDVVRRPSVLTRIDRADVDAWA
jgi:hypothetical protein